MEQEIIFLLNEILNSMNSFNWSSFIGGILGSILVIAGSLLVLKLEIDHQKDERERKNVSRPIIGSESFNNLIYFHNDQEMNNIYYDVFDNQNNLTFNTKEFNLKLINGGLSPIYEIEVSWKISDEYIDNILNEKAQNINKKFFNSGDIKTLTFYLNEMFNENYSITLNKEKIYHEETLLSKEEKTSIPVPEAYMRIIEYYIDVFATKYQTLIKTEEFNNLRKPILELTIYSKNYELVDNKPIKFYIEFEFELINQMDYEYFKMTHGEKLFNFEYQANIKANYIDNISILKLRLNAKKRKY